MPAVVVDAQPFFLIKPKITLGYGTANTVEMECAANEIDASPEQDSNDTETFCGIFTSYKPAKWTVTFTVVQSFGTTGFWNNVRPLVNTLVPFEIIPDTNHGISATNPAMRGTGYLTEFPFLQAAVGEASEMDFVLAVQGVPTFTTTPLGYVTNATGGTPGTWTPSTGVALPASVADLIAGVPSPVTPSPATAWTTGQYIQVDEPGSAGEAYWNGTAWVAGRKP